MGNPIFRQTHVSSWRVRTNRKNKTWFNPCAPTENSPERICQWHALWETILMNFQGIGLRVVKFIADLIQFEPCSQKSNSVVRQSKIHSQIGQLSMYDSVSCRIQRLWKDHTVATEAHMDQKISMYDTHHRITSGYLNLSTLFAGRIFTHPAHVPF